MTDEKRELAYVDQGYTGKKLAGAARADGIALELVKSPKAKRGFTLRHALVRYVCRLSHLPAAILHSTL
ncbi:hypothetical protein OQ496_13535 [Acetobacter suratthaniensis]|uniref:Transposase n=1 Tax=Acetobacter suratthaniensis TaxID=1502841 RepID=A0ABS3LPT5_9PROT|nr:hypothetical protein [Acetobacter suratthaniensis]MBO1329374.1 hypothetical protein [Acetobacter suratthaniensis]MCX2567467.1 hypothetical protein [Acetobacter suratthaniensis]